MVVGAGSIVTKKVSASSEYAGVPAKPLKPIDDFYLGVKNNLVPLYQASEKDKRSFLLKRFYS